MTNPSTRRDPLLIPLVVALVVAVAGIALFVMRNGDYQQQQTTLTTLTQEKAALEANVADLSIALDAVKANDSVGSYQMTMVVIDGEEIQLDGIGGSFEVYEDGTARLLMMNGTDSMACPFLWSMNGDELVLTNMSDEFDDEFVVQRVQGFTRFRIADAGDSRNYMMFEPIQ